MSAQARLQNKNSTSRKIYSAPSNIEKYRINDNNINSITSKIELHKTLWFNSFRSYDIAKEKNQIPILIEKLKHRFDILIKISSVLD